jgi:hypothetical protein
MLHKTSFVQTTTKHRLQIKAQAQAAEFYKPNNRFTDTTGLKNGCSWMRDWPDHELVKNKSGLEAWGVINKTPISGYYQDSAYAGNDCQIPQTMAGVEIDVDSDDVQEWLHN